MSLVTWKFAVDTVHLSSVKKAKHDRIIL